MVVCAVVRSLPVTSVSLILLALCQVSSCARLTSAAPFNFEANATVDSILLSVCDNGAPMMCTTSSPFSIVVVDVNEAPYLVYVVV